MQEEAPELPSVSVTPPGSHRMQSETWSLDGEATYLPMSQLMHEVADCVGPGRYWPAAQLEHAPVFEDLVHRDAVFSPALHVAHCKHCVPPGVSR